MRCLRLLPAVAEERVRARTLAQLLQLPLVDVDCYAATALATNWERVVRRPRRRHEPSPDAVSAQRTLSTRVHMASVHFVADWLNYLIAGTLDRTDLTLGVFTRYAESDVDLLPLGTAHRSEVIALARDLELPQGSPSESRPRTTPASTIGIWRAIRPTARMASRRRWRCGSSG